MAKLIIENLTLKQAKELARWYQTKGNQDSDIWLLENNVPRTCIDNTKRIIINRNNQTVTISY